MLSQFEINHIKHAFQLARQNGLNDVALAKFEYAEKLIRLAEEAETVRMAKELAGANDRTTSGLDDPENAQKYLNHFATAMDWAIGKGA